MGDGYQTVPYQPGGTVMSGSTVGWCFKLEISFFILSFFKPIIISFYFMLTLALTLGNIKKKYLSREVLDEK